MINNEILAYNQSQTSNFAAICALLAKEIDAGLSSSENKFWHGHPVWFLNGNPTVGYSIQKPGVRLMFWSGADFDEEQLLQGTGKFKDASIFYNSVDEVNKADLMRWLEKSEQIQWDYKNIIKNKGNLKRL